MCASTKLQKRFSTEYHIDINCLENGRKVQFYGVCLSKKNVISKISKAEHLRPLEKGGKKTTQKLSVPATFPGAGRFDGSVPDMAHVWSLTQSYSVVFLISRIIVKMCFCKHIIKVCVSCFQPLETLIPAHHNWWFPCIWVVPKSTWMVTLRTLEGPCASSKSSSVV